MTAKPDRLQGTDGIRGVVVPDDEESRRDPVGAFLQTEKLTPSLAELYVRAFSEEETSPGGEVIVGWDPRDRAGDFTGAAVRGILLAGRKAVVLGTVPTPAVPLVMVHRGAKAGIMVTASHNPESQNGLKAFVGPLATKLYPVDEVRLTRRVYDLDARGSAKSKELAEGSLDWAKEARKLFLDYSCDSYNSWLPASGESAESPLSDLLLVVDAAGGSMAGLAQDAFQRLGVRKVVEVNGVGAPVNQGGGVVELEQVAWVDGRCISDGGRDLSGHAGVSALLALGKKHRDDLRAGRVWAAAAVFDGDGDRSILLVYDPFRDGLSVLDGDKAGLHMARFLAAKNPQARQRALYVNTVDSDLGVAATTKGLGYETALTAVGDKWLLWRAGLSWARGLAGASGELTAESGKRLKRLEEGEGDARALGELCQALDSAPREPLFSSGKISFTVGCEASGHHVTIGRVESPSGSAPVIAGNGLKAAINTFVAMRRLANQKSLPEEWIDAVCRPFPSGCRRTCYAFYTERVRFAPGTDIWEKLEALLGGWCEGKFGHKYRARRLVISEDPGMLYLALDDSDRVQRAGVFVRNSGTEERTGVTVQGGLEDAEALNVVAEKALKVLLVDLKRKNHPYRIAEAALLERLKEGDFAPKEARSGIGDEVEPARLLKEMERQGLIRKNGENLTTSELGIWYTEQISKR